MPGPNSGSSADRNLLFGILALQLDFISQDELIAAMAAWVLDKGKSLGDILRDRGRLSTDCVALLAGLVDRHVERHSGDPRESLAALPAVDGGVVRELGSIADGDLTASIAATGSDRRRAVVTAVLPPSPPGRYEILRRHARGGLGEVFVARDHELDRDVALKEIQTRHADDPDSRTRFVTEAVITGGLEHPGIVPVYGLGQYADGRPYYAMRFVKGDDLRQALRTFHAGAPDVAGLEFRTLLRRFVDTCNAVAYAHSRGVIHRDVKPGNIMLGKYGETLLVDWGIAKVIGRAAMRTTGNGKDEATLQLRSGTDSSKTVAGHVLGSPAYMSPEQAAGRVDELAAATDVYSLGATLYELLTGKVPFPGDESGAISNRQFVPPRQVRPGVPRPLEAVCLKAMALRPEDRYPTPLDLAADVDRWLGDEPVSAWPEPWGVRARRWARKHRPAVVGAAVFLTSTVVALAIGAGLLWNEQQETAKQKRHAEEEWVRAEKERQHADAERGRAEENLRTANAVAITLVDMAEKRLPDLPRTEQIRKGLTDTALGTYQRALRQRPADPEIRRMAALFYRISANMHNNLKEVKVARPYYQESVRLFEALVAENPSSTYRLGLAESFRDYSQLLNQAGELGAAREALRQCIDRSRKLVTVDPKYAFYRRTLASALLNLSAVEYDAGRYVESRDACKESAAIFAELLRAEPKDLHPYDGLFLAMSHNRSAIYLRETGSPEQALREHGQAVTEAQRVLATSPENNNFRNFVGRALVEQGRTLALKPEGRLSAEKNFSDAILIWRNLRERNPDYPLYKDWLAVADEARATIRLDLGRRPEARNDLAESRQILEELVHDHSESPDFEGHLARTYLTLARLAQADSDRPSAAEWLAKAKAAAAEAIKLAPEDARLKRLDADVLEQSKNGNSPARPE